VLENLKNLFKKWNEVGINIPVANDQGIPSLTMFFAYVSFLAVLASLIYIHIFPDKILPTIASISVWVIALVIYKMRKLDKFKFNLQEKSFELDAQDELEVK